MAEKIALPLILPSPPSPKPRFPNHISYHPQPSPSPPITPLLQDVLHQNFCSSDSLDRLAQSQSQSQSQNRISPSNFRERTRIGMSHDANRGKPWTHRSLSPQGQAFIQKLIDPSFDSAQLAAYLVQLIELCHEDGLFNLEFLSMELLGIVKGLGYNKKGDLVLSVVEWVRSRKSYALALTGSVISVVVNILGKEGKVAAADALLHGLRKDEFEIDVYAYTALITAFASNGRYRDAVMVFKKIEEEGCKPTLFTYNVALNVYGKMGMPWNKIIGLIEGMESSGMAPDLYT